MTGARLVRAQSSLQPVDSGSKHRVLDPAFRFYKAVLSPVLHTIAPTRCLYLPTCSEYAYTAIARFGIIRGSWMAMRRFARCHPWAAGGLDPVPNQEPTKGLAACKTECSIAGSSAQNHLS